MLRISLLAGFMALGCASSTELEDRARTHAYRSEQAAARGDYNLAAREKEKADDLHRDAVKKAYKQGETAGVQVPANVPAPAKGY